MRGERAAAALLAALLGCTSAPPAAQQAARIEVEVLAGLAHPAGLASAAPSPVLVLLDATLSMQEREGRSTRERAARQVLGDYLAALPLETPVELHVLGLTEAQCSSVAEIEPMAGLASTQRFAEIVAALPAGRSETSLAAGLESLARALDRRAGLAGARVVVVSDFVPACAGDPCAAAAALVARGAEIEAVAIGPASVPECLEALTSDAPPPLPGLRAAAPAPVFRVEAQGAEVVRGRAGAGAVGVAPGRVVVHVELEPPLDVGPVELAPGAVLRVRILEFRALEPPLREVWLEVTDATRPEAGKQEPGA